MLSKMKKSMTMLLVLLVTVFTLVGCTNGGIQVGEDGTSNTLFLYPINYFGIKDKAFTSRWDGMKAALVEYEWTVEGDGQKDSKKFRITRNEDNTMPEDTRIVFVNNQTWDTGLALTNPLAQYQPLAVISTVNGVEFASQRIASDSPSTQNVTMGGFGKTYEAAFKNGTLHFLAAKYSASVAPIVAAIHEAVNGNVLRNPEGYALNISQEFWFADSYEKYLEMASYDVITGDNPTIKKADMNQHIDNYESFQAFIKNTSKFEDVKTHFNSNRDLKDTIATTPKYKIGLLVPNSINESIQSYLDYIEGYLAKVYNYETERFLISGTVNQVQQTTAAANAGCKAVISLQDDTDRENSIIEANKRGVYYGIAGAAQGPQGYEETKALPYFIGSVGTALNDEFQAGYTMVKYYLEIIKARGEIK